MRLQNTPSMVFFDSLRAEIHTYNVDVTLVCPGYVNTNVSMNALTGDGSPQNKMDKKTASGLVPEHFAKKMLKAVKNRKQEVVIGGSVRKIISVCETLFSKNTSENDPKIGSDLKTRIVILFNS